MPEIIDAMSVMNDFLSETNPDTEVIEAWDVIRNNLTRLIGSQLELMAYRTEIQDLMEE